MDNDCRGAGFELKPKRVKLAAGETKKIKLKFKSHKRSVKRIRGLHKKHKSARKRSTVVVKAKSTGSGPIHRDRHEFKLTR